MRQGRLIQDLRRGQPERVATTVDGMHFVPVFQLGDFSYLDLRVTVTSSRKHPTYGWASYPVTS